jgi:hypothetical protein
MRCHRLQVLLFILFLFLSFFNPIHPTLNFESSALSKSLTAGAALGAIAPKVRVPCTAPLLSMRARLHPQTGAKLKTEPQAQKSNTLLQPVTRHSIRSAAGVA